MNTLLVIILLLVGVHFIFEAILLPSIRQSIRFRLFRSRDNLRRLKFNFPNQVSDSAFSNLDEAITLQMHYQHRLTFGLLAECDREFHRDPSLQEELKQRMGSIERCRLQEFQNIERDVLKSFTLALAANCFMGLLYVFPFALAAILSSAIKERFKARLKKYVTLNERDMSRLSAC